MGVFLIVEHKTFYLEVMKKDDVIAEPIAKEMDKVKEYEEIAGELKAIVKDKIKG